MSSATQRAVGSPRRALSRDTSTWMRDTRRSGARQRPDRACRTPKPTRPKRQARRAGSPLSSFSASWETPPRGKPGIRDRVAAETQPAKAWDSDCTRFLFDSLKKRLVDSHGEIRGDRPQRRFGDTPPCATLDDRTPSIVSCVRRDPKKPGPPAARSEVDRRGRHQGRAVAVPRRYMRPERLHQRGRDEPAPPRRRSGLHTLNEAGDVDLHSPDAQARLGHALGISARAGSD